MPDSAFPDRIGIGDGPMTPCKVIAFDFTRLAPIEPLVFERLTDLRGTLQIVHPEPVVVPFAEVFERMAALLRPLTEAFRVQFEAICTAVRPLAEYLAEHPELLEAVRQPAPESCRHLCGRVPEHECLGEADGAFAYRDGGHPIPMCAPCRATAAARLQGYDGAVLTLIGGTDVSAAFDADDVEDWGEPLNEWDANWPDGNSNVCAHVCGGDAGHVCDVRAATQLTYELPSGGTRSMPICQSCFNVEWAARQRYELVTEGELVRLDCKECPETLLRVPLPAEEAHDAIHEACAEHSRLKHPASQREAADA